MDMLSLCKQELDEHSALIPSLNPHIQSVVNAIPFSTVDTRMKATIAVAQLTNFAAQFRRNVVLWDETEVPINAISFILTGSGMGKDSSVKMARKCFTPGLKLLEHTAKQRAIKDAIAAAQAAGDEPADQYEIYKSYMKPIPPIDIMPTTGPGLIQHINDIGNLGLLSSFLYTGEFSDELAYNQDMVENIKILSEVYDLGEKEAKYTKGAEFRSNAIHGQPVSALFVGSPGHILYDEATKKKFHVAFMSKLARRSWFCYTPDRIPEPVFDSLDDMLTYEEQIEQTALQARHSMADHITTITKFQLQYTDQPIKVSQDVSRLFKTYKRYNSELIDSYPNQGSTYALIRRHLQWKALKLAGAFAIMDMSHTVELSHYIDAIRFCELLDQDMQQFEHDINKADHERFSDYIRTLVQADGKASISLHELKKLGFIKSTSSSKLHELVQLSAGYDHAGIYSVAPDGSSINYAVVNKTSTIGISYKPINCDDLNRAVSSGDQDAIDAAKHHIATSTAYGFELADTTFDQLTDLLSGDYAYSPFKFRNGVRSKDNLINGTKWLVLDIDSSALSASEAHFLLSDINHHIALSSDPSNEFKFRVLLELDAVVELSPTAWKHFYLSIASDLGLKVDPLPQSQIFFSYSGRPILSVTDAEPITTREYIIYAREKEADKQHATRSLSTAQQAAMLDDWESTFYYAVNAPVGTGSRNMYRMITHAKDLGASLDHIYHLIDNINELWSMDLGAMHPDRINLLKQQAARLF